MNGIIKSASELYPDGNYTGDAGSSTNPWCVEDYADLKACNDKGGCTILTNDIDCSEFNVKYASTIVIPLDRDQYFDFNGYSIINVVARNFPGNGKFSFIRFLTSKYTGNMDGIRYIKNISTKNIIFANAYGFTLFDIDRNNYNTSKVSFVITNPYFEVYICNKNSSNTPPSLINVACANSYIKIVDIYNLFMKISGIEDMQSAALQTSCLISSHYSGVDIQLTDSTVFFNDYKILSCLNITNPVHFIPNDVYVDTINLIGKLTIIPTSTNLVLYMRFFQNSSRQMNSLINMDIDIILDEETETSSNIQITDIDCSDKIFVNKEKINTYFLNNMSEGAYHILSSEQLNDVQFLLDNGMVIFDTD